MHADDGQPTEVQHRYRPRERGPLAPRSAQPHAQVPAVGVAAIVVVTVLLAGLLLRAISVKGAAERTAELATVTEQARSVNAATRPLAGYGEFVARVGVRRRAVAELGRMRTDSAGRLADVLAALPEGAVLKRLCGGEVGGCGPDRSAVLVIGCARSPADVRRFAQQLRRTPGIDVLRPATAAAAGACPDGASTDFAFTVRGPGTAPRGRAGGSPSEPRREAPPAPEPPASRLPGSTDAVIAEREES